MAKNLTEAQYMRRYGIAIASVLIAFLLMLVLDPFLQLSQVPSVLFFSAVTISAFYGGRNSGIVATLLSAVFINYFLDSQYRWTFNLASGIRLALFFLEGLLISVLVGALHKTQAQLRQNVNQLKATEADVKDLNQALQSQVDELQALAAAKLTSDDRYRILVESMDEGFCLCELLLDAAGIPFDYRFLEVNPVFEALTGLQQVVGKTARELVPNLEEFWFETYGRVVLTRESIRFKQRSLPMERWFDVYAFPVGEPQHYLFGLLFTNITTRKVVEQERERFLAVSSDLQVVTGINGYFQWVSPTFERVLGWTAEEMTSRPWTEFVHPDDIGKSVTETDYLFSGNETVAFENRYRHQDGSYRWLLWNAQPDLEEQIIYGAAIDITERKQAEQEVWESERRFRRLVESNMFGVAFGNFTGEIHYVNDYFLNMVGYTRAELEAGQVKWTEITPPEFLHLDEQAIEELKIYGVATPFEKEYIRKDGSRVPMLIGSALLQEPYNQHQEMIAFYLDLTNRKQAENAILQLNQQLQEKVNELQTLLDVIPVGIGIAEDRTCHYIRANPAFARLLNVPPSINTSLSAPQEERPTTFKVYQNGREMAPEELPIQYAATHGVEVRESELEIVRQDGTVLSLVGYAAPLLNELGQPRGSVAAFLDITARKQAEMALREKEQQLQQLSDSMPQFVWVCNSQGELEYVNLKWVEYSGLTIEQSKNPQQIAELYHPDDRQNAFDQWAIAVATKQPFEIEAQLRRAVDKTYHWFLVRAVPQFDDQGQVLRWIGTSTDIDDHKQVEQEREQLLVREQAAREQAEAANRIKDEFLAVISHELRSPLNPILGWSRLLQTRQFDEQKKQAALDIIARNAQIQAQLINDLLDVSRVLRGKLTLNTTSVDLVTIIQSALETVRLAAEAKSIQINTVLDPEAGQFLGDPDRLQQVVWNLLSNAVKFTSPGGRVDIRLERLDTDAQIMISDTGKGIHPDFLPYVFDRFRQEDAATTRQFGGLGLGLALVRYLVEMHGGTVQAESPGEAQGATFTVKLPLSFPYQPAINPQVLELSQPGLDLNGIQILVVDDDNNTREFIAFLLELHGANVMAVATATDAIATLAQFKPDLLLSDIGMPNMDGYMLMRQVRALPPEQGGQVPAIALTAYAGEIDYQQAMAVGFQKHIVKPVEPETLVTAIAELMLK